MYCISAKKIGVVVSRKKVVASATPNARPSRGQDSHLSGTRRSSFFSIVGLLGKRSPRVSPTSSGGSTRTHGGASSEAVQHRELRKAFLRRGMASEGVEEVEDMETEMSPEAERKYVVVLRSWRSMEGARLGFFLSLTCLKRERHQVLIFRWTV